MKSPHVLASSVLLICALCLAACTPTRPGADDRDGREVTEPEVYGIDIALDEGRCRYDVQGTQEEQNRQVRPGEQDSVLVLPGDYLRFVAEEAMLVSVRVHESPEGIPGLAGEEQAQEFRAEWQPRVREPRGQTTEHHVEIRCCLPAGSPDCEFQQSFSRDDLQDMGSLHDADFPRPDLASGPSAGDDTPGEPLPRPGGPTMKVIE